MMSDYFLLTRWCHTRLADEILWNLTALLVLIVTHCGLMTPYGGTPSGSTLTQAMACCIMVPSHCLNQCWLFISVVLWPSPGSNFYNEFENDTVKIIATSSRGQWVYNISPWGGRVAKLAAEPVMVVARIWKWWGGGDSLAKLMVSKASLERGVCTAIGRLRTSHLTSTLLTQPMRDEVTL